MQFLIPSKEVIRYISLNPNDEEIILTILRTYPGIYELQTNFNISLIAKKSNHKEAEIHAVLQKLKDKEIIAYQAKNNDTVITFNEVREDERTINRVSKYLEHQNNLKRENLKIVLNYIQEKKVCKSTFILDYFGEKASNDCGICSNCINKKEGRNDKSTLEQEIISL